MMYKARECGLLFNPAAEKQYLQPDVSNAIGPAHDEWKLIPWGLPQHRTVPPTSVISNSVQLRLSQVADYRPENLDLSGSQLNGYKLANVLPYQP